MSHRHAGTAEAELLMVRGDPWVCVPRRALLADQIPEPSPPPAVSQDLPGCDEICLDCDRYETPMCTQLQKEKSNA